MREEYEKASQQRDYHFEEEVLEFLGSFLRDNERKIDRRQQEEAGADRRDAGDGD